MYITPIAYTGILSIASSEISKTLALTGIVNSETIADIEINKPNDSFTIYLNPVTEGMLYFNKSVTDQTIQ